MGVAGSFRRPPPRRERRGENMNELVSGRLWDEEGPVCVCEWPQGLPRTFDDLVRDQDYAVFVAKKVERYNQVKRNFEDLLQEIWLKLIQSDLLNKFVLRSMRTPPDVIHASEAAEAMGISFEDFGGALFYRAEAKLNFEPAEGPPLNMDPSTWKVTPFLRPDTLFKTSDIQALDRAYPNFHNRPQPRRITWPLIALGFRAYLTQAIHNHFANFCRTKKRKDRDLVLDQTAILLPNDTGRYMHVGHSFEATEWESRLVAIQMADDDMLTVVESLTQECEAAGIDIQVMSEVETYTETYTDGAGKECKRVRQRPTARALQVIELVDSFGEGRVTHPEPLRRPTAEFETNKTNFGDGRTMREALKVQQRAESRARTRVANE